MTVTDLTKLAHDLRWLDWVTLGAATASAVLAAVDGQWFALCLAVALAAKTIAFITYRRHAPEIVVTFHTTRRTDG
jgi:hypothetical protein